MTEKQIEGIAIKQVLRKAFVLGMRREQIANRLMDEAICSKEWEEVHDQFDELLKLGENNEYTI